MPAPKRLDLVQLVSLLIGISGLLLALLTFQSHGQREKLEDLRKEHAKVQHNLQVCRQERERYFQETVTLMHRLLGLKGVQEKTPPETPDIPPR